MMTPEARVKTTVKKLLEEFSCYHYWPTSNGMGAPALDCIGCYKGRFFSIECKAPGKKPTRRQEITIDHINEAQGKTFVIDGPHSLAELKFWLEATR
jgi:hypothetical protein